MRTLLLDYSYNQAIGNSSFIELQKLATFIFDQ